MWFGTEDGLNRFDGYEFRQLRHDRADDVALCRTAGSPRWSRAKTACGSRPTAAASCSATRSPANSTRPLPLRDSPDLQRVRTLARDRLGRLWIASRDAGRRHLRCAHPRAAPPALCADAGELALRQLGLQHRASAQRRHAGRHRHAASTGCRPPISTSRASRCRPSSSRRASRCACGR